MEQEHIDFSKLSVRELVILVTTKVERIEKDIKTNAERDLQVMLRVNTLETLTKERSRYWGAVSGLITGIITTGIGQVIIYLLTK